MMSYADQSTMECTCENCRNWERVDNTRFPHRGKCKVLITKDGCLYAISSAKHLEVEHLKTWPAFACPQFEERQQGPFSVEDGVGLQWGYSQLWMDLPGQTSFRIASLPSIVADDVCDKLNSRWRVYLKHLKVST